MGRDEVVPARRSGLGRMLGTVWICESNMDSGSVYKLESNYCAQLCIRGCGFCAQCRLLG